MTPKLKLKVNQQKSAVARPWERKYLGFSFTKAGVPKRRIAPKAVDRFKERVRELTCRTKGVSIERMAEELATLLPRPAIEAAVQAYAKDVRERRFPAVGRRWRRALR